MKSYKGFPSALHKTKLIIIEFRNKGTLSVFHEQGLFETIKINYNINRLWYSDRTNSQWEQLHRLQKVFHCNKWLKNLERLLSLFRAQLYWVIRFCQLLRKKDSQPKRYSQSDCLKLELRVFRNMPIFTLKFA